MSARILAALALLVCLPLTASAQFDTDARLQDEITSSLRSYTRLTIFDDVTSQVQNGIVTIAGKVTMPFKKDEIARRLADLGGVEELRNDIQVLPVSIEDDELRKRVARAIYGNSAFFRYAAMPRPPIHIIVDNGYVTLMGIVPTEVDRALARSLAAGNGERGVTCALRTESESR
ncbi:MAG: BON domain-containing protein [Acidobacteriota bacterium]|nr:BON domain-containing protein [Acidobacteriota bacterium]